MATVGSLFFVILLYWSYNITDMNTTKSQITSLGTESVSRLQDSRRKILALRQEVLMFVVRIPRKPFALLIPGCLADSHTGVSHAYVY